MSRALALALIASFVASAPALAQTREGLAPATCDVTLNGAPKGEIVILVGAADVYIALDDFDRFGLLRPAITGPVVDGRNWVPLRALAPSILGRFNDREIELDLVAAADAFALKD